MATPPVHYVFPDSPVCTCTPVEWTAVCSRIIQMLKDDCIQEAWTLWEDSYHSELVSRTLAGPRKVPGRTWHQVRRWDARVTVRGEENRDLALLYSTARRLLDDGKHGGARAKRRIYRALESLPDSVSLPMDANKALEHPLSTSDALFKVASTLQASRKKKALNKWERSLVSPTSRPNPCLYRWLRGESPATVLGLETVNGPTTSMGTLFCEHRKYWESICTAFPLDRTSMICSTSSRACISTGRALPACRSACMSISSRACHPLFRVNSTLPRKLLDETYFW